ncbi:MAG TPA: OmpA family protein [Stellaceae bacterium]|jgi:OOP family OmpA-OmpF porin|nr:OmpA family protein [Stellaceae bacterium]
MKRLFLLCSALALAACAQPAPPPPTAAAPPPPPPPPEHNFTVFFDWDRANITPEGAQIVEAAAATFKSEPPVPLQVIGHTDTSGSPDYNLRLSQQRAQNVATALSQAGVPQSDMTVSGVGENDLKVSTPPGVREPQNRRTEIIEGGSAPPPPPPSGPPPAPGS